jgi:hypothetical protein
MSSRGKKKTTMAKLTRESRLRERRQDKVARKEARKNAPPVDPDAIDSAFGDDFAVDGDSDSPLDGDRPLSPPVSGATGS